MEPRQAPPTLAELRKTLAERREALERFDVRDLSVFGSVARGSARTESDIDVLVEFAGPPTFRHFMGLKLYLEDLFGLKVDLVTRKALRPELRDAILDEAVHVA